MVGEGGATATIMAWSNAVKLAQIGKRMMGLEPTTFCMASAAVEGMRRATNPHGHRGFGFFGVPALSGRIAAVCGRFSGV
jgi:hypothetical protein